MFVRSSKFFEALVRLHQVEVKAAQASAESLRRKVEIDRLTRELQDAKDDYLHRLRFKRVIVHIHSPETSVEGILAEVYKDTIVVRSAQTMISPVDIERLEGGQIIPLHQIAWVQDISGNVRA